MKASKACTWAEVKLRAHYVGWLAAAIGAAALLGVTFDLVIVQLTGGEVGLALIPLLYLSATVPPYVYAWRRHGEAFCRFLELEQALHTTMNAPDGLVRSRFGEVIELIARIDATRGMERQLVRNEAKAWLLAHAAELSSEERDFVADHLGYLHRR